MSYDLLFLPAAGASDPLQRARELAEREFDDDTETLPSDKTDDRRRALVHDLLRLHPSLFYVPTDDGEEFGGCVESDDDSCPVPAVELGVASGMIALSYSDDPPDFKLLEPVINVFRRHGFVTYDPQQDALVGAQLESASGTFKSVRGSAIAQIEARGGGEYVITTPQPRRPWWRFW